MARLENSLGGLRLFESVGSVLEIRPPDGAHTVSRKISIPPELDVCLALDRFAFFEILFFERIEFFLYSHQDLSSTDLLPLRDMISTKPGIYIPYLRLNWWREDSDFAQYIFPR